MKTPTVTAFRTKVYEACKTIPSGSVATYKTLAEAIGSPKAFRAVGSALRHNPFAPVVPCHRVVASDRTLHGFSGSTDPNGTQLLKKRAMLVEEGVSFDPDDKVAVASLHHFIVTN